MSTPVALSGPSRSPVVRPTATVSVQVIEVDTRRRACDPLAEARARQAAARYGDHGTHLLGAPTAHGAAPHAERPDPADGWTLVGYWLTAVAVLSVCAVAFASYGTLPVR